MLLNTEPVSRKRAISLTPLIDVVFILLLFFMLSSTFIQWRQIDVSAATESTSDAAEKRIVTLLSDEGQYRLDGRSYSMLDSTLTAELIKQDPSAIYLIEVKSGIKTQTMIDLLDAFKQAGAKSVSLSGVN